MDGIVIINKPKGLTSQNVVSKVKKILNEKKVGHTGTLDPLATGVLPILIGNATKLSKYLIEHDKTYIATLKLGVKTDTGDLEGEIVEKKKIPSNINNEQIEHILKTFIGKQKQIPPMYSAIKINGKKLYEYAREEKNNKICGNIIDKIKPRDIEIYWIKLIEFRKFDYEIDFEVKCSKGTYIRTLCENIAEKLNTVGFMKNLIRTSVNNFTIEKSYSLEGLEKGNYNILKIENVFDKMGKIELNDRKKVLYLNGVMLTYEVEDGLYNIYNNNNYIGIGVVKNKLLKRDIVIG